MITRIFLAILAFCFASISFAYIVDGSRINRPRLLSYAKDKLPNQGTIQQSDNGFTYLKVSDQYITELLRQLDKPDFKAVSGAHILVMQQGEAAKIDVLLELGETVHFKPLGFYTIVINDKEYFKLAVDAPELSSLRLRYGLSEKFDNHAFHITIGVRQLSYENQLADPKEISYP